MKLDWLLIAGISVPDSSAVARSIQLHTPTTTVRYRKSIITALFASLAMAPLADAASITLDFDSTGSSSTLADGDTSASGTEIRWQSVATIGAITVDLVGVVSGGTYNTSNTSANGLNGQFGQINLYKGSDVNFTFTLVDPNNSDVPVVADSFKFAVFDVDYHSSATNPIESVTYLGTNGTFGGYTISSTTELDIAGTTANPTFTATTPGDTSDNPNDPNALTAQQQNRTVLFHFLNASSIELNFATTPNITPTVGGRNLLFAGEATFANPVFIPEPSSALLSVLGISGLLLRRSRKK